MRTMCMMLIVFTVSSLVVADTVMVGGGVTYNGIVEFNNGKFSLNADGELQQFLAQDVGVVWFNAKKRGSKRPSTSSVRIVSPIHEGPLATIGTATSTVAKPTTNANDRSDAPKNCLLVFKNGKSVRGTLLSIQGNDVVVEVQEDTTDKTNNSEKKQLKKESFKKDEIARLDCR